MNERTYHIRIRSAERELVAIDEFRLVESSVNVLLGESGIGKSLTALAISGLLDNDDMDITIDGRPYSNYLASQEASDIRQHGFFVFQEPSTHLNPLLTLKDQLNEGSLDGQVGETETLGRLWHDSEPSSVQRLLQVYPKPYRPSGGEKQRVLATMAFKKIARTKKNAGGALFVFDEPTGNLDNKLRDEFLDLLMERFQERQMTVLLITHDYSMISRMTREYPEMKSRIFFKEFYVENGKLHQRDFHPSRYLEWVTAQKLPKTTSSKDEPLLRLSSGARVFGRSLTICRDPATKVPADLVLRKGRVTYLKAPSGTGKTTVLKMMMGLLRPEHMMMRVKEADISQNTPRKEWHEQIWGKRMTMVFQHADEALNQNSDVKGVFSGLPVSGKRNIESLQRMLSLFFGETALDEFMAKPVIYLSGGQKQRLNLLRSFALDTQIILLDEPFNGLDFDSILRVIEIIRQRLREGKTSLIVSHNEEIVDHLVLPEDVFYLHASN